MTRHTEVGAVILAAGASTRLGQPKQSVSLDGETLLDRAVRVAREAGVSVTVVVLGAFAEELRRQCTLLDCTVVENPNWHDGMGSSIRHGIAALGPVAGAVLMTCDMPFVSAEHLRALYRSGRLSASHYAGKNGVPAYFPRESFVDLGNLDGRGGAKELLHSADAVALHGDELDIDVPGDIDAMLGRR
jgi:CTP:molybdopterin cytidylyltransferase MocA